MSDSRKRYKCECECGSTFYATKSLMHHMGQNDGGCGSCPECGVFYNLTLDEENNRMILTEWNKWVEERKEKDNEKT